MKNGSLVIFEAPFDKGLFKAIFIIPFAYIISLFTGARVSHVADILDGNINEFTYLENGFSSTPIYKRLQIAKSKGEKVFVMEPIKEFSENSLNEVQEFNKTRIGIKYGIGAATYTVLDKIPLINKINFGRKGEACSIYCCQTRKIMGILPLSIDPFGLTPKELIKLIKKTNLYKEKVRII